MSPTIASWLRRKRRPATDSWVETATRESINGTQTEYEEGVEIDQTKINGGGPYSTLRWRRIYRSIPTSWSAIRLTAARLFTPGTSSARTRSTA